VQEISHFFFVTEAKIFSERKIPPAAIGVERVRDEGGNGFGTRAEAG
jgi:hypothetical protein